MLSDIFSSNSHLPSTQNEEYLRNCFNILNSQQKFNCIPCSRLTANRISSLSATNSSFDRCTRDFISPSFHSYSTSSRFLSRRSDANISNCRITNDIITCNNLTQPGKQTSGGKNTFNTYSFSYKTKGMRALFLIHTTPIDLTALLLSTNTHFKTVSPYIITTHAKRFF